jgi:hypothetical protein
MNSKKYRDLQEAYLEVVSNELDEGIGSAIKGIFKGKKKKEQESNPQGRTAELRQRYGITNRTGPDSPRGRILNRMQQRIDAYKTKHGEGSSAVKSSTLDREQMLRGGYSQYAMNDRRGSGNAAKRRISKEEVDLYDIILSHLLDEGYVETSEAAEVIMVNMSEEWRESILMEREHRGKETLPVSKMKRKEDKLLNNDDETMNALRTPVDSPERKRRMKQLQRFDNINSVRTSFAKRGGKEPHPMPEIGRYKPKDEG